jgi:hypothetical protein
MYAVQIQDTSVTASQGAKLCQSNRPERVYVNLGDYVVGRQMSRGGILHGDVLGGGTFNQMKKDLFQGAKVAPEPHMKSIHQGSSLDKPSDAEIPRRYQSGINAPANSDDETQPDEVPPLVNVKENEDSIISESNIKHLIEMFGIPHEQARLALSKHAGALRH